MATRRPSNKSPENGNNVETFMADLVHPHKDGVERLRNAILGIDGRITEEVKWNAPSFKLDDHFATFKLHPPKQIQLVLHIGSKPVVPPRHFHLDVPPGLVKWAASDRCVITLQSTEHALQHEADVVSIVRQWITQL